MQKSEFFAQTFFYVLGGLVSNTQNIKAKSSDLVETAFNTAKLAADRYQKIASSMDPTVVQQFTVGSIPTDVTLTYTVDLSGKLNDTPDITKDSVTPTAIKQPDGETSIAVNSVFRKP